MPLMTDGEAGRCGLRVCKPFGKFSYWLLNGGRVDFTR